MNLKSNFGLGLATGVAMCLSVIMFMSAKTDQNKAADQQAVYDALKGEYISVQVADDLINAYDADWIQAKGLPENTTIGGVIGRSNLAHLASQENSEYIKFRFYFTEGDQEAPQIGLIFYPSEEASAVLRTGSGSFCPTVCVSPN